MKSFIPYRFPVWAILLFVLLAGCQKDRFLPDASRQESQLQTTHYPISLGEAQTYFEKLGEVKPVALNSLEEKVYLGSVTPDWANAFLGTAVTGQEVAIAPLSGNKLSELNAGRVGIKLLFAKVGADSIAANLLVYVSDSAYHLSSQGQPSFNNFTGLFLFFDLAQNFKHGVRVINGVPMGKVASVSSAAYQGGEDRDEGNCRTHFASMLNDCIPGFSDCRLTSAPMTIMAYEECGPGGFG
ncbi:MAG: hypothetical protein LH618_19450, partial [Saprospiraceae bacterium]|nr:hypothetical protein [Saprospiraceae bacterium]